jgi:hypothetical protein
VKEENSGPGNGPRFFLQPADQVAENFDLLSVAFLEITAWFNHGAAFDSERLD